MTENLRDDPTLAGVVDENTPDELIDPTLLFAKTARDAMIATGERQLPELVLLAARIDAVLEVLLDTAARVRVPILTRREAFENRLRIGVEENALHGATEQLAAVIAAFTPDPGPTPAVTLDDLLAAAQDPTVAAEGRHDAPRLLPAEFHTVRRFDEAPSALDEDDTP